MVMVVMMALLLMLDILESDPYTKSNTQYQQNQHTAQRLYIEFIRGADRIRFNRRYPIKLG